MEHIIRVLKLLLLFIIMIRLYVSLVAVAKEYAFKTTHAQGSTD